MILVPLPMSVVVALLAFSVCVSVAVTVSMPVTVTRRRDKLGFLDGGGEAAIVKAVDGDPRAADQVESRVAGHRFRGGWY